MVVGSFDIMYEASRKPRDTPYKSNAMDMLSPSGFALIALNWQIVDFLILEMLVPLVFDSYIYTYIRGIGL